MKTLSHFAFVFSSLFLSSVGLAATQDLYVSSANTNSVLRYDGATGAFVETFFVPTGSAGLNGPSDLVFGPDVNLYVSSSDTNEVLIYDGTTGAPVGNGKFVTPGSGGLTSPSGLAFIPGGDLLVASKATSQILRFSGADGTFVGVFCFWNKPPTAW